jgi:hypothetical protein
MGDISPSDHPEVKAMSSDNKLGSEQMQTSADRSPDALTLDPEGMFLRVLAPRLERFGLHHQGNGNKMAWLAAKAIGLDRKPRQLGVNCPLPRRRALVTHCDRLLHLIPVMHITQIDNSGTDYELRSEDIDGSRDDLRASIRINDDRL